MTPLLSNPGVDFRAVKTGQRYCHFAQSSERGQAESIDGANTY
jgi:hypothetical protein